MLDLVENPDCKFFHATAHLPIFIFFFIRIYNVCAFYFTEVTRRMPLETSSLKEKQNKKQTNKHCI